MKPNLHSRFHRHMAASVMPLAILCLNIPAATASPISGNTVTGDLTVDGSKIIIDDGTDHFEIRNGTNRVNFWHADPGQWVWSYGTTPTDVMSLDSANILSLYDLGALSVNPAIVLDPGDPDATPAAIPPSILIGGDQALTVANSPTLLASDFVTRTSNNLGSQESFLMEGTFGGSGDIPASGAGTRMMWYPERAAFRVGRVTGNHWDDSNIGDYSTAMGYNVRATGDYSVSLGRESLASGMDSVAIGYNAQANGTEALALGGYAKAIGDGNIALGSSEASGYNSVAIGQYAYASQYGSVALGLDARATGYDCIALAGGKSSADYALASTWGEAHGYVSVALATGIAHGDSSVAIGGYDWGYGNWPGNESFGENATTIGGVGNKASGFSSFASGFWTKAASGYSVALGSLNLGQGNGGDTWIDTDPLFELGNGHVARSYNEPAPSNRSNAITTLKNGQTALINKAWKAATVAAPSDPEAPLADYGANASGGNALVVDGHTVMNGKVVIAVPQGDISMGIYGN